MTISNEILNWMQHSLLLADDRLAKEQKIAKQNPERSNVKWWIYQEEKERQVIQAITHNDLEDTDDELQIWYQYMTAHASLQIQRASRQLADDDFYERCRQIRNRRDQKLQIIFDNRRDK